MWSCQSFCGLPDICTWDALSPTDWEWNSFNRLLLRLGDIPTYQLNTLGSSNEYRPRFASTVPFIKALLDILRCERVRGHFQSLLTWTGSTEVYEIQTRSLLFVPVQILLPLGRGKGGVDLCRSHPHLNNLHSRCHHYTEVASLCTCL